MILRTDMRKLADGRFSPKASTFFLTLRERKNLEYLVNFFNKCLRNRVYSLIMGDIMESYNEYRNKLIKEKRPYEHLSWTTMSRLILILCCIGAIRIKSLGMSKVVFIKRGFSRDWRQYFERSEKKARVVM